MIDIASEVRYSQAILCIKLYDGVKYALLLANKDF